MAQEFAAPGESLGKLWRRRSVWQVRLRWFVPPAILLCMTVGSVLGFVLPWLPLLIVALAILAYNTALAVILAHASPAPRRGRRFDLRLAVVQVSLDYAALLTLLHFTGGLASPLLFFLVFHVIVAAMLFAAGTAYLFAVVASTATAVLALAEYVGGVHSHPLSFAGQSLTLENRPGHLLAVLVFFSAAMFITAALSNTIMGRLRERVLALAEATRRAAALNDKLGSLYVMVEAISAQKVLDRVLTTVVEELTKVTEVTGISVKLVGSNGETLRYAAVHGLPPGLAKNRVIELSRSPFNRRVMEGQAIVLGQLKDELAFQLRDELLAAGIESVLLAPLTVQGRVIGVLGAYRQAADQFDDEDLSFFKLAANLVAIAIDDARQAEAIEQLLQERSRLLLQVAHNLRAPLSAATTMLDTVGGEYLGPVTAKQAEYLQRIGRRLQAMSKTVGELLTLANARRAGPAEAQSLMSLVEVASDVVQIFQSAADAKGLRLEVATAPDLPAVRGHRELLRQLVENLISNAIKYTLPGGSVTVRLSTGEAGSVRLEVEDSGIGIPESEQDQVYDEFFRASNARELDEVGTGLGLPLVKQIAAGHGGEVHIQSTEGSGTRVQVTFPAANAEASVSR